jgi:hypothetical protein
MLSQQDKEVENRPPHQKVVYIKRLRLKLMQISLLYSLIFWLLSFVLKVKQINQLSYQFLWLLTIALTLSFSFFCVQRALNPYYFDHTIGYLDLQQAKKVRSFSLLFSGLIIVTSTIYNIKTLLFNQTDPSGLESIADLYWYLRWLLPFFSLLMPLIFSILPRLILKYEVKDNGPKKSM